MSNRRNRSTRGIFTLCLIVALLYISYQRFWYTEEEKIVMFYEDNRFSFELLKDKISTPDEDEDLRIIDSLKNKLSVRRYWITYDTDDTAIIHLNVDFENYVAPFEYWYCVKGLKESGSKEGPKVKKLNDNWGIFR
ncbi:MAG: hypothetical protein ACK5KN_03125 [Dysgonomonas sp.]|uniref:hypothetical protein n=1 Tax=Dysgonomonas sp. TaxID=1891233 RepID=UPI003A8B9AA6